MKTIIVPLDFSETSLNAAHYAARMFNGQKDSTLILYHFYELTDDKQIAENYLVSLQNEFEANHIHVEIQLDSGDNFIDRFAAFAHIKRPDMIIMGLTGKTPLAQRFSGTNTLKMAEKNICPVLVVPAGASFGEIKNVMIASEMKGIAERPVLLEVKKVLKEFKPSLHILNVDSSHYLSLTKDFKMERDKMEALLAEFNPEFHFMRLYDFHESINLFTADKNIDMIIIAPKYHGFFELLFKTQHAKTLLYHSKIPVLLIHE
jgi:nucleotide-binding universal stress UspA family protein